VIRRATLADLSAIEALARGAVAQMRAAGNPQWDETYPAREDFARDIARGELYVVDDGGVGACACINRDQAPEYASVPWSLNAPATVVHRMAVDRSRQGQGLAKALLAHAETLARRDSGYLRSDTYQANAAMNALFARMGYGLRGFVRFRGKPGRFNCYDKSLRRPLSADERAALEGVRAGIEALYGWEGDIPRINYGPCGVFADLFFRAWNARFADKVHICFVMTGDGGECDHVCVRLPDGSLYDGGAGVHTEAAYPADFTVVDMWTYDRAELEKWSYGLERSYPRYCPDFDREAVRAVIRRQLDALA
jgi:GNAT superfamily N-acetyltransferase